ncbi:hypothetical protein DUI87_27164 [Hirundo rustica rustica]|uniref:ribonuclease H n=1 Tax=Hirundo rustica rustica TaxID=333673 RepID=A0A3M0JBU9_HIRRU|nr:hypothetical protein DUI87_27164 [Hirundo rustica rustica]
MRPVFDKGRNSRAVGSSSTVWTLPPCQVTIRPRDHGQFWGEVRAKVEGLSGDPDAGARLAVSDVQLVPSRVPASDPVGSTGQDRAGAAASSEGLQAFPVLQGATHSTYQPLAWQALTELRDVVRKYGLGSAEVMQVLRSFNASLLTPFDIRSLARALFPPVEYDFFENKWTQLAVRAVERNTTLGPGDPRRMVNIDMLMGTGNYTRAEGQAGYEPLVQEQCQQTGMAALVQTLQLATPQQPFATIVQGIDEPFLCFAGRLTAAVEKQWLVDRPIWENQWPLPHDKLVALHELVQEQLDQGHLEPSTSPWNTPVFCIKKKFGKWRLLQDLRKINAMMEGMGTLQAAHALSGVRKQFPDARVYHYMDDILVATPTQDELLRIQPQLLNALHSHGLQVAPEKVYRIEPSIDVTVFISLPGGWRKALGASGLHLDSAAHVP